MAQNLETFSQTCTRFSLLTFRAIKTPSVWSNVKEVNFNADEFEELFSKSEKKKGAIRIKKNFLFLKKFMTIATFLIFCCAEVAPDAAAAAPKKVRFVCSYVLYAE